MTFEQIAVLENQFKIPMSDSERIAIAIKKLPPEYKPVLAVEMSQEGSLVMASHIENAAFQYWQSVHGSYAVNLLIDSSTGKEQNQTRELALTAFNRTCNRCG